MEFNIKKKRVSEMPLLANLGEDSMVMVVNGNDNFKYPLKEAIIDPDTVIDANYVHTDNNLTNSLITTINNKIDKNTPITVGTKTKITYDSDGLVTSGSDATTADIADSTNKRYVTDLEKIAITHTNRVALDLVAGNNTGNETNTSIDTLINTATNQGAVAPADTDLLVLGKTTTFNKWTWANFKTVLETLEKIASETQRGEIFLSTLTEVALGINDNKATTPVDEYASSKLNHPMLEGNLADLNMNGFSVFNDRAMVNVSGGFMVKRINKTGASSVKGTVVTTSDTTDNAVRINPTNGDMACGVMFEDGIPDGQECWVVTGGIAQVLLVDGVAGTRNYIAYSSTSVAGRIDTAATIPAASVHFTEIGHTNESKAAGTNVLVTCFLHFN